MTPIEQLVRASEADGVQLVEHLVGTEGARKIFECARPMPKAVRELGFKLDGLHYSYWMAGNEGLKEGFGDWNRAQDIHFPAALFSTRRVTFYLRRYKLRRQFARDRRLTSRLTREWQQPNAPKVHLNSDLISPETNEYLKISAANSLVSAKLTKASEARRLDLHWSYGDSRSWRVIAAIPTESELEECVSAKGYSGFANDVLESVESIVELDDGFRLYLELDSNERVNGAEGWFFRIKGDPRTGREFAFEKKENSFSERA